MTAAAAALSRRFINDMEDRGKKGAEGIVARGEVVWMVENTQRQSGLMEWNSTCTQHVLPSENRLTRVVRYGLCFTETSVPHFDFLHCILKTHVALAKDQKRAAKYFVTLLRR